MRYWMSHKKAERLSKYIQCNYRYCNYFHPRYVDIGLGNPTYIHTYIHTYINFIEVSGSLAMDS